MNGTLKVSEGLGLGVEIDEEKAEYYYKIFKSGKYHYGLYRKKKSPPLVLIPRLRATS